MKCPYCQREEEQVKDGQNKSGTQKYRCKQCQRRYTPEPAVNGYSEETRLEALRLYVDGMNFRRIGRHLDVSHQSVANWVRVYAAQLPTAPVPQKVETVEMDELYTFIGEKKTESTL